MRQISKVISLLGLIGIMIFAGCTTDDQLKEKMGKILKDNPKMITDVIEKNPADFILTFQKAAKDAQGVLAKKKEEEEKQKLAQAYDNPLVPVIRKDESIRGKKGAPLVLVEYSDFECPYCTRGFNTVVELMKKYGDKLQFIYKHLPLSFHRQAMLASQYYEAIRLQDEKKAFKFHDEIFKNQRKLKNGEKFLKATAKSLGVNMAKLAKDYKSAPVLARIEEDQKEAAKFGMQGTPGFLLNGIPVKGAYPTSHFDGIIEELKKRGKVKL